VATRSSVSPSPGEPITSRPSPTTSPVPTSDPTVAKYLKPLVSNWQPAETTVIATLATQPPGAGFTLVAVPASGGSAKSLITDLSSPDNGNWDVRRDGSALVVAVTVGPATSRLAMWDMRSGVVRWITAEDTGVDTRFPRWSSDGAFVYFGRVRWSDTSSPDLGLFRVTADGSNILRIHEPLLGAFGDPQAATNDGVLLWWKKYAGTEGASLEALDLASGRERSSGACMLLESWRSTQPRALVQGGVCAVGPPLFNLVLWNDVSGEMRQLTGPLTEQSLGGDWDLTGTRIVAAVRPLTGTNPFALVTMDATGGSRVRLQGTENGRDPVWLAAGTTYVWSNAEYRENSVSFGPPYEVRLIAPSGGTSRTLYRTEDEIVGIRFVKP
jgi:hypothetical protein